MSNARRRSTSYFHNIAPTFVSGLTDTDMAFIKAKCDAYLPKDMIQDRDATAKALAECEVGWN